MASQLIQDHVIHFYHLHALDWVDVVSALKADPAASARLAQTLSPWPNNGESEMRAVQERLKKFVGGGQLGIFTNRYWGHPAYKLPPEVNLLAVAHYLDQAIREVMNSGAVVESNRAAILAALRITAELFEARDTNQQLSAAMRSLSAELKPLLPPGKRGEPVA